VNKSKVIGKGSMRVAYAAKVKTELASGTKEISDYVAKERFIDEVPTLSHHATDARMYQACGLLLNEYKHVISGAKNPLLTARLKKRASEFNVSFYFQSFLTGL
jgi:hypothetical protein